MFGKKKVKKAAKEAEDRYIAANQTFIRNAVFGKNPLATSASGDQADAALADHQKIVNPHNKSKRPKRQ